MPELDTAALASGLSQLDPSVNGEMLKWIEAETSKAKVQNSVHNFTDMCWKKCIKTPINSNTLSAEEGQCMENCLHRFLDANINVVKWIQESAR